MENSDIHSLRKIEPLYFTFWHQLQADRTLERKCEEEAAGRATCKVCAVEAFEGTAAHYALEQRITVSHAGLCSHLLCIAQGQ